MPYPNEHAARLEDPDQFDRFRRKNDELGDGVDAIYGIKNGKATLQAIRFDSSKWSASEAKKWLKAHDHGDYSFEAAVSKREEEFEIRAEIAKYDEELRMVWGFAYVCKTADGEQVVDHSLQMIPWQEMQKASIRFGKLRNRKGGVMHEDQGGEIVEQLMFSPDIQKVLGIDVPVGLFIGYHVADDEAWEGVKDGTYSAFSIHGMGLVTEIDDDDGSEAEGEDAGL